MDIKSASLSFIVGIIMKDLQNYIEVKEPFFTSLLHSEISDWIPWIDEDLSTNEIEIVIREIHENLGSMFIWDHDPDIQNEFIEKIECYFNENYDPEQIEYFSKLVIECYKDKLKDDDLY